MKTLGDLMNHPAYKAYEYARQRLPAWKRYVDAFDKASQLQAFPDAVAGLDMAFAYIDAQRAEIVRLTSERDAAIALTQDELDRAIDAIDVAYVAADDKPIGSKWDLETANIVCNGLMEAQWVVSTIKGQQHTPEPHNADSTPATPAPVAHIVSFLASNGIPFCEGQTVLSTDDDEYGEILFIYGDYALVNLPYDSGYPGQMISCRRDYSTLHPVFDQPQPAAPTAGVAPAKRPIPVLTADEAELLDDMLAYDPHYERTEKREPKKHQMLVELEKHGLVFWYKNPGEDKAWTLSAWGRSVAAHYNVADDGSDATPDAPVAAAQAAPAVKLTAKQRDALEKAAHPHGVWNDNKDNQNYHSNRAKLVVLRALEKMGYVKPLDAGHTPWSVRYAITDAGRRALRSEETAK